MNTSNKMKNIPYEWEAELSTVKIGSEIKISDGTTILIVKVVSKTTNDKEQQND